MREREKKERYREEDEEVNKKGEKWRREAVLKDAHERDRGPTLFGRVSVLYLYGIWKL